MACLISGCHAHVLARIPRLSSGCCQRPYKRRSRPRAEGIRLYVDASIFEAPPAAWKVFLEQKNKRRMICTSMLVDCVDELSRSRCKDFTLLKVLADEVTQRIENGATSRMLTFHTPTAIEATSLLRSFAGIGCRYRRFLDAVEHHLLQLPRSTGLQSLRFRELVRLVIACGQLKGPVGLACAAVTEIVSRGFSGHGSGPRALASIQLVHACTQLRICPGQQSKFWTVIVQQCYIWALQTASLRAAGRDQVSLFSSCVKLQAWFFAQDLAIVSIPRPSPVTGLMDLAVWLGSMAVLLGLSRAASVDLLPPGLAALEEALAATICNTCSQPASWSRQILTFAIVLHQEAWLNLHSGLQELLLCLDRGHALGDDGELRKEKSRLQQEVLESALVVIYTGRASIQGTLSKLQRPVVSIEEPCLVYSLDIVISPESTSGKPCSTAM